MVKVRKILINVISVVCVISNFSHRTILRGYCRPQHHLFVHSHRTSLQMQIAPLTTLLILLNSYFILLYYVQLFYIWGIVFCDPLESISKSCIVLVSLHIWYASRGNIGHIRRVFDTHWGNKMFNLKMKDMNHLNDHVVLTISDE